MRSKNLAILFLVFVSAPLALSRPAQAEVKLYPSVTVMEIYDDNLYNDEEDEVSEFVTRIMPTIALEYQAPRAEMDLAYTLDYRYYLKGERNNEDVHFLDALSLLNWKEKAFLEIADRYSRVSLDSARDYREESLFSNQSNQNIFSVSPYLRLSPTARTDVKGGYQYVKTDYEEEEGDDSVDHIFFLEGAREVGQRTTARLGYKYIDQTSDVDDHSKQDVWSSLRHEYGEDSYVFGSLGYTWIDFEEGASTDDIFWDFGVTHDFRLLVGTAAVGVRYVDDPEGTIQREESYRLSATRDWTRSRLTVSGGVSDFYDSDIDRLDTRRYGGTLNFFHELTSRWSGIFTFSGHKYEEKLDDTWTRRLIGSLGLSYMIAEDFTTTLTFYRIDSHSPQVPDDRFETNRVFLEARMVF